MCLIPLTFIWYHGDAAMLTFHCQTLISVWELREYDGHLSG